MITTLIIISHGEYTPVLLHTFQGCCRGGWNNLYAKMFCLDFVVTFNSCFVLYDKKTHWFLSKCNVPTKLQDFIITNQFFFTMESKIYSFKYITECHVTMMVLSNSILCNIFHIWYCDFNVQSCDNCTNSKYDRWQHFFDVTWEKYFGCVLKR